MAELLVPVEMATRVEELDVFALPLAARIPRDLRSLKGHVVDGLSTDTTPEHSNP